MIRFDRLLQLAEHLEKGKLIHETFNFKVFNSNSTYEQPCGAAGCALGECPAVFPSEWRFIKNPTKLGHASGLYSHYIPVIDGEVSVEDSAITFFGLSSAEDNHLFYPYEQQPELYGGVELTGNATREEVASNIREFVRIKQAALTTP